MTMKTSDSIKELATALAKAQAAMGGAHKDSTNPAFNSKYADLSSVVDAIKPHLTTNGIAYMQFVRTTERDEVGVETILMHSSGEFIAGDAFYLPVSKANAHGFGSALTYARRYSLAAACGLKADDDDGNAASNDVVVRLQAAKPINGANVNLEIFEAMGAEEQQFIRDLAVEVLALHDAGKDCAAFLKGKHLDPEEKMALWSQLPSNVRSAIKRAESKPEPALASQA